MRAVETAYAKDQDPLRETLAVDREVPVGFQKMRCQVRIAASAGTNPNLVKKLLAASEQSCVNGQTLRNGVAVETVLQDG